jgi:hypothetical protein
MAFPSAFDSQSGTLIQPEDAFVNGIDTFTSQESMEPAIAEAASLACKLYKAALQLLILRLCFGLIMRHRA